MQKVKVTICPIKVLKILNGKDSTGESITRTGYRYGLSLKIWKKPEIGWRSEIGWRLENVRKSEIAGTLETGVWPERTPSSAMIRMAVGETSGSLIHVSFIIF